MTLFKFTDAVLFNLSGKVSEDFITDKTNHFDVTAEGLTDLKLIYGADKDLRIAGSQFPYLRFELLTNTDAMTDVVAQKVAVEFEIGISLEREANSNTAMIKYLDAFKKWLKSNKIMKLNGEIVTIKQSTWEISFQYGGNTSRKTIDERFAVLQGGWILLSESEE